MPMLLRSGTSCPCLTSLDWLTHGSLPQDPSLTKLRDGTDASTHRNAVSKPRRPSQQGSDVGALPRADPPLRPPHTGRGCHASHHTMPSAASPSISMHAEHGPCQAGPASPSIDADDTAAAPPPTPGCRLKDRHPYSRSRIAAPPSGPAHGRPAAYACYEGVKRRARPCPVKHLSRRGATTPLSPLPHWLHGGQGHCTAALAAAAQPWWSGGGDSLTSRPPPKGRDK